MANFGFVDSTPDDKHPYNANDFNAFLGTLFTEGIFYDNTTSDDLTMLPFFPSIAEYSVDGELLLSFDLNVGRAFYRNHWFYGGFSQDITDRDISRGYEHLWAIFIEVDSDGFMGIGLAAIDKTHVSRYDKDWRDKAPQKWSLWVNGYYESHPDLSAFLLGFFYVYYDTNTHVIAPQYSIDYCVGRNDISEAAQWSTPRYLKHQYHPDELLLTTRFDYGNATNEVASIYRKRDSGNIVIWLYVSNTDLHIAGLINEPIIFSNSSFMDMLTKLFGNNALIIIPLRKAIIPNAQCELDFLIEARFNTQTGEAYTVGSFGDSMNIDARLPRLQSVYKEYAPIDTNVLSINNELIEIRGV